MKSDAFPLLLKKNGHKRSLLPAIKTKSEKKASDTSALSSLDKNRFHIAVSRVASQDIYDSADHSQAPYGYFKKRPIIAECSRISGGVYLSAYPREAVVVDEKYGFLDEVYRKLTIAIARQKNGARLNEKDIVLEVVKFTAEHLPFSEDKVRTLSMEQEIKVDQRIALDFFIKERVGVARHQVLLAGYLLQRLKSRNIIQGCVYLDPLFATKTGEDERLIYTSSSGYLITFTPYKAQELKIELAA